MAQEGGCTCGAIRYRLMDTPLFINACHCTHCQRSTGSAFMISLVLESSKLEFLAGETQRYDFTGGSGAKYDLNFCGACGTPLWGCGQGPASSIVFLRAGTLDDTSTVRPDAHIYTCSKQTWLDLPDDIPRFDTLYDRQALWPPASMARLAALLE